jgi:hypothetical protein
MLFERSSHAESERKPKAQLRWTLFLVTLLFHVASARVSIKNRIMILYDSGILILSIILVNMYI